MTGPAVARRRRVCAISLAHTLDAEPYVCIANVSRARASAVRRRFALDAERAIAIADEPGRAAIIGVETQVDASVRNRVATLPIAAIGAVEAGHADVLGGLAPSEWRGTMCISGACDAATTRDVAVEAATGRVVVTAQRARSRGVETAVER